MVHPHRRRKPSVVTHLSLVKPCLEGEEAGLLGTAYRALRDAEHRLQMVGDQQTHSLPEGDEALDNVAALAGG